MMQKDLKIGMLAGAGVVLVGWILFGLLSDTPQQRRQKQFASEPLPPASQTADPKPSSTEAALPGNSDTPRQEPPVSADHTQIHVVQAGETLISISIKYYGKAVDWQKILDANQDILQKPEQLRPGMRLKIPPK